MDLRLATGRQSLDTGRGFDLCIMNLLEILLRNLLLSLLPALPVSMFADRSV